MGKVVEAVIAVCIQGFAEYMSLLPEAQIVTARDHTVDRFFFVSLVSSSSFSLQIGSSRR